MRSNSIVSSKRRVCPSITLDRIKGFTSRYQYCLSRLHLCTTRVTGGSLFPCWVDDTMISKEQPKPWEGIHQGPYQGYGVTCRVSCQKTRRTPQSSAWLPRHLRHYWRNIGLSVLDVPG